MPECEVSGCCEDELAEQAREADVLIPAMTTLDRSLLGQTKARLIQQFGVGLDSVDVAAATECGIYVANVPSSASGSAESVAELAILLMLSLARSLPAAMSNVKAGRWAEPMGTTLFGKTIGIVGVGNIGRVLAQRLRGFGVSLLGVKRTPSDELRRSLGLEWLGHPGGLSYLLERSDFVVLTASLNPTTKDMIGAAELARMRPNSFLINVGRGGLVDCNALELALRNRQIAGAGLDVFWQEPADPHDPILSHNVVAVPHIGSETDTANDLTARAVAENVRRVARGEAPLNCVNPGCRPPIGTASEH